MRKPAVIATLILLSTLALTVFGAQVPSAAAATIMVNRFDDPDPNGCPQGPVDCSLREAIILANISPGPDTISLPAGTYTLSREGLDEDVSATGDLDITSEVSLVGAGAGATVIDGGAIDRVLHVGDPSNFTPVVANISALTVRNGHAPDAAALPFYLGQGGGIYAEDGVSLTISDAAIVENKGDFGGGGIFSEAGDLFGGSLTIERSVISGNTAGTPTSGSGGAGIRNHGIAALIDSVVTQNDAGGFTRGGFPGGGIDNRHVMSITRSIVSDNVAGSAAGVSNSGTLVISESSITQNRAATSGAGISGGGEAITITRSTIAHNFAGQEGGGIEFGGDAGVILSLEDSTIQGNYAETQGGGIYNWVGGDVFLRNVTMSGNYALEGGDAIYLESGNATIINSTFANNMNVKTGSSALVNLGGSMSIRNSILSFGGDHCVGLIHSIGYNIDHQGQCDFNAPGDQAGIDPLLDSLDDNGGPTLTHQLRVGSPAIDAADDLACTETDQRGWPRSDGNGDGVWRCDIGAVEFGGLSPNTPTRTPTRTPLPSPTATPTATAILVPGDANCDGDVSSLDAALILQRVARLITKLPCPDEADANRNGAVDAIDAALVLQISAGLMS